MNVRALIALLENCSESADVYVATRGSDLPGEFAWCLDLIDVTPRSDAVSGESHVYLVGRLPS